MKFWHKNIVRLRYIWSSNKDTSVIRYHKSKGLSYPQFTQIKDFIICANYPVSSQFFFYATATITRFSFQSLAE